MSVPAMGASQLDLKVEAAPILADHGSLVQERMAAKHNTRTARGIL